MKNSNCNKKSVRNMNNIMEILKKHFNYAKKTTLNRMKGNEEAFKILISCLLSLRTKDEITEKVSFELFKIADTPEKIIKIPLDNLKKIVYQTGHYNKKANILKSVSKEIINKFDGKIPDNYEKLISIKGIGPKTANIVLNFAFGKNVLPIDTHCHRIPNRLGLVKTKTPEKTELELIKILPKKYWGDFNGIFVLFGRTICAPISPFCTKCPIEKYCCKMGIERSR